MKTWLQRQSSRAQQWFVVAALIMALVPAAAHASVYGSGTYNTDVYNGSSSSGGNSGGSSSSSGDVTTTDTSSASTSDESTVVETPSGLQVAINLSNGQSIPATGYYITITPLNGQGKTFDKAEIYLDGKLVYSGKPDSTGTLKWFWDTASNPASKVKIIVFGPGEGQTTHEFNVSIASGEPTTGGQSTTTGTENVPDTSSGWPVWIWWLVGFLILLFILVIWWLVARRRRREQDQLPPPPTYKPMQ